MFRKKDLSQKFVYLKISFRVRRISMDIGRVLIFIPIVIYCFYSFSKSKQNIYLILWTLAWYGAIYSGKLNVYQSFQEPLKSVVNMITIFFLLLMFVPYLKQSIKEYEEYKNEYLKF